MFSPATKRAPRSSRKDGILGRPLDAPASPATPASLGNPIPNRPSTGTPAPWAPRLSVLARIPPANTNDNANGADPVQPMFVGEFPQLVRDEQTKFTRKHLSGPACVSGGMDKATCLCWLICGSKIYIWNYLTPVASRKCVALELPSKFVEDGTSGSASLYSKNWLVGIVNWDGSRGGANRSGLCCNSAGVVMCNKKTRAVLYWPNIYTEGEVRPIIGLARSKDFEIAPSPIDYSSTPDKHKQRSWSKNMSGSSYFRSMIAAAVVGTQYMCVALACSTSGELWQIQCSPNSIQCKQVHLDSCSCSEGKGYPMSLSWRFLQPLERESSQQFFLLTDHDIHCFVVKPCPELTVSKLWHQEIIGTGGESAIKKDLAGQKQVWPLDIQVDDQGKVITILIATIGMDRLSSSSYTQYSLLTMQQKSEINILGDAAGKVLEKKAPLQVIIPKARFENEDFLFAMRLRTGGRPQGSAIVLSADGTATVSYCYGNSARLYKFDLPYDAGNVLDASVLPSTVDNDYGAWVVLTEKAGVWAIPEKAVVLCGVEPPNRSLSRKGGSNEWSVQEERVDATIGGSVATSSREGGAEVRQGAIMSGLAHRRGQDEQSEALVSQLFDEFVSSGKVDGFLEKFKKSSAFERDGETNVFARKSKSIVDTLAKHWTTTRGAEIVAMAVISSQLVDKQQKHQQYLQFLALSKCHEELCSKQRHALQIILEHGEKLAGIIQIRELQNSINEKHSAGVGFPLSGSEGLASCALWDLIQLVGERARRNTVLLMDRDNAEVFYSKVSDLEELFYCLEKQLGYIVRADQPLEIQIQRACELSNVSATILRTAMLYKNDHRMWYPPLEGLTPWYSQPVVRKGLWSIASYMLYLLSESSGIKISAKSDIQTHLRLLTEVLLEAYACSITAKRERGEESKALLDEYWSRRDTLLESLYQQIKSSVEAGYHQEMNEGNEEQNEAILRKLASDLLPIAKQHEGYKAMWRICYDLNDLVLLKNLMHESVGPQGGFSYFVFKQIHQMREFSKLLRLGEEFPEELLIFLKNHPDLLWLHEVFLHQFSSASDTLHVVSLSQDGGSISTEESGMETESAYPKQTLGDRRRLLNLSKIAAMAGKNADSRLKVKRIEADLKLLKLQEEITKALACNEAVRHQLLHPEELIDLCLNSDNPQLVIWAFDIFAWTSASFRKSHLNLLEECWRAAVNQDDWGQLYEAYEREGWTDGEMLRRLQWTVLFQASSRCYGPRAETLDDGGFEEILPLRQEPSEVSVPGESNSSSVEAILRRDKDFSESGKLMVTAVVLGSLRDGAEPEEGPFPME